MVLWVFWKLINEYIVDVIFYYFDFIGVDKNNKYCMIILMLWLNFEIDWLVFIKEWYKNFGVVF